MSDPVQRFSNRYFFHPGLYQLYTPFQADV